MFVFIINSEVIISDHCCHNKIALQKSKLKFRYCIEVGTVKGGSI